MANADDVEVLWSERNGRAGIVYPVDFEYGMRAIRDDNGYQLNFGARLPN